MFGARALTTCLLLILYGQAMAQPADIYGHTMAPLIAQPSNAESEELRQAAGGGKEYILVFNDGTLGASQQEKDEHQQTINTLLTKLGNANELKQATSRGCEVGKGRAAPQSCESRIEIGDFVGVIVSTGSASAVDQLRKVKGIQYVEEASLTRMGKENKSVNANPRSSVRNKRGGSMGQCPKQYVGPSDFASLWGLDHIDVEDGESMNRNEYFEHHANGSYGVKVYVLSSGIRTAHTDFEGRAQWGKTVCPPWSNPWLCPCTSHDAQGHGTRVAGTVAGTTHGVAKKANVVAVKVMCNTLLISDSNTLIRGIEWSFNNAIETGKLCKSVIIIPTAVGASQSLDAAVNVVAALGIPVVVASGDLGNLGIKACQISPARADGAITVGSIGPDQVQSGETSGGSCVDIFAPGERILSAGHWSNSATVVPPGWTSVAASHVAGAVAVYRGQQSDCICAHPYKVFQWLISSSVAGVGNLSPGSPDRMVQVDCYNNCP